jgi:hypothetical protein
MYSPLKGRNGRRGVLRHVPPAAKVLLRPRSGLMFDTCVLVFGDAVLLTRVKHVDVTSSITS